MTINLCLVQIARFLRGVFSDGDQPSSSRILSFLLFSTAMALLWRLFTHLETLTDPAKLGIWLANLPMIIGALAAFVALPYTINRGTTTLTDVVASFAALRSKPCPPRNDPGA